MSEENDADAPSLRPDNPFSIAVAADFVAIRRLVTPEPYDNADSDDDDDDDDDKEEEDARARECDVSVNGSESTSSIESHALDADERLALSGASEDDVDDVVDGKSASARESTSAASETV